MYKFVLKRILDFLISMMGLLILSPLILLITILLFTANRGNPFFFQLRPGRDQKIFKIVKFRTMTNQKDNEGNLLPDDQRLTKIGKLVRKTSLDEIPQLFNVLKGDMSLIGPRPLLIEYLPLYSQFQNRRHEIRPGITGWAQVNGRNTLSWNKKFEYDVWYVDHLSFILDIKIILMTVKKVFISEGISAEGKATMDVFRGNNV
ncbi:sugar transferase [Lutimonas zeaxanthinifaciens]|uniref:sugar transferase n=1 Tax=Lutimonas zeaxanthinifaciens TaxID=3060215 RepID=UPI00265CA48D|nr:sugar transferase [Lutimonas sp. YSD2104]WKK67368.1 sugar transferase [Lutimonas sp. YSD2104]